MQLAAKTSFMHFFFQSSFKKLLPFSTTLPFYLVVYSHLFPIPITCFQHLKTHFLAAFRHVKHLFSIEMKTHNPQLSVYFYAFSLAFYSKIGCVQVQNGLRFAPKQTAFCTKIDCVLHQNRLRLDAKCSVFCTILQGVLLLIAAFLRNLGTNSAYSCLATFYLPPPFLYPNKPSRESIICGRVGGWWTKEALIMLKFLPKSGQKECWRVNGR